jgi:purine-binding chemotaxis protein CheW
VLLIRLGDEWFALAATRIREIVRWREPTPVPGTPPALLGVFNLRGAIVPLVDPRMLLNLQQPARSRNTRLVVVDTGLYHAALLADEVWDLLDTSEEGWEAPIAGSGRAVGAILHTERGPATLIDAATLIEPLRGS